MSLSLLSVKGLHLEEVPALVPVPVPNKLVPVDPLGKKLIMMPNVFTGFDIYTYVTNWKPNWNKIIYDTILITRVLFIVFSQSTLLVACTFSIFIWILNYGCK